MVNDNKRCNSQLSEAFSQNSKTNEDSDSSYRVSNYSSNKPRSHTLKDRYLRYEQDADFELNESRRSSGYKSMNYGEVRRSSRTRNSRFTNMNEHSFASPSPSYEFEETHARRSVGRRPTRPFLKYDSPESDDSPKYARRRNNHGDFQEHVSPSFTSRSSQSTGRKRRREPSPGDMYSRVKSRHKKSDEADDVDVDDKSAESNKIEEDELSQIAAAEGEEVKEALEDAEIEDAVDESTEDEEMPQRLTRRRIIRKPKEDSSDTDENAGRRYHFRERRQAKPAAEAIHSQRTSNRRVPRRKIGTASFSIHKRSHISRGCHNESSEPCSEGSSSDEEHFQKQKGRSMAVARSELLPMNFKRKDLLLTGLRDRQKAGASLADIDPMNVDQSILFDKIGGLSGHLDQLREMVLFPLLYPEVFKKYNIQPPRGVLFHGPPGTGKTLVARALANEYSEEGRKVAFFMRKGADCMSKWVGESERQLRLLFDQAYTMRPSIIFFDEIDGIAPVRSTRQDQIHSSIVSTLLALMDGLDDRGEVIVIGATNRVDAIDPALRRPGRFDREFYFPLPSFESREEILKIHTKEWQPALDNELLSTLAARTVGYCGADLKALCAETALLSLKRRYPQIYSSNKKLLLNIDEIKIELRDFNAAIKKVVPASQRSSSSSARPLNAVLRPLLKKSLLKSVDYITSIFPPAIKMKDNSIIDEEVEQHLVGKDEELVMKAKNSTLRWPGNFRPRFLLHGPKDRGQSSHLAPAILHYFEHLSHIKLDFCQLNSVATRSPEESLSTIFSEAMKRLPAILYIPHINNFWEAIPDSLRLTFLTLLGELESTTPLLILATSDGKIEELDEDLRDMFNDELSTCHFVEVPLPDEEGRKTFFSPLFENYAMKRVEEQRQEVSLEILPEAPIKVERKLNDKELKKLRRLEEQKLRSLRLFLREVLSKIIKDKRFTIFVQPVDVNEVSDYLQVISKPMDLERMMRRVDDSHYECAEEFLNDIELIKSNALEYNPARDSADKMIRHLACTLKDFAVSLIDTEMDSDFEAACQDIATSRRERGKLL